MAKRYEGSQPTCTDVKAQLSSMDQLGLLGLIHDLYVAHQDNQTFLHARFGLEKDILKPYKENLHRWLWPDVFRNQDTSVAKAKQAISSFKKAVGDPDGLAELHVRPAAGQFTTSLLVVALLGFAPSGRRRCLRDCLRGHSYARASTYTDRIGTEGLGRRQPAPDRCTPESVSKP